MRKRIVYLMGGVYLMGRCLCCGSDGLPAFLHGVRCLDRSIPVVITTNTYEHPVLGWQRPPLDLPTNGQMKVHTETGGGDDWFHVVTVDKEREKLLLEIDTVVCTNAYEARKVIAQEMNAMTATWRYKSHSCGIGDYCFRIKLKGTIDHWVFSRNNIKVSISCSPLFSAESIARQIDADILKCSLEPPSREAVK